ncbi:MAG: hypothetical protein IJ705_06235 [Oscillospiraceae bacterium]|nr:hypothetical protein [Oscillospiraceae bacterium]
MEYVIIRPYPGAALGPGAARALVAYALRRSGRGNWDAVGVDAFSAAGRALLLARPLPAYTVAVADYALPLLQKYFTE